MPDEDLRALERRARQGDPQAVARLNLLHARAGRTHRSRVACGGHFTLVVREERALRGREEGLVPVPGLEDVPAVHVAAGWVHAAVLASDGRCFVFTDDARDTPAMPVPLETPVVDVACGLSHVILLGQDGVVRAFGGNDAGQLGQGSWLLRARAPVPLRVEGRAVRVVAGGARSAVLLDDGTLLLCSRGRRAPTRVATREPIVDAALAYDGGVAVTASGEVLAWRPRRKPVRVPGLHRATAVSAGQFDAAAITDDGVLWVFDLDDPSPRRVRGVRGRVLGVSGGLSGAVVETDQGVFTLDPVRKDP